MTDFSSAGAAQGFCFACGIAGHIVVVHISLGSFVIQSLEHLAVGERTECSHGENLCLTAGKESRAVCSRQECNLGIKRTDFVHSSAVHTLFVIEEPTADNLFLNLVDKLGEHHIKTLVFLGEFLEDIVHYRLHLCIAYGLVVCIESFHDSRLAICENLIKHIMVKLARGIFKFRLADCGNYLVYENEKLLYLFVRLHDCVEHRVVVNLAGTRFDHDDFLFACRYGKLKVAYLALLRRGVDDNLAVNKTYKSAADRSVPRNIGDGKRDGCAYHGCDLG